VLFIVGNRLRRVRFDSEKLSSQQWTRISELTGLPEKAKIELEGLLGFYRELRNDARQHYGDVAQTIMTFKKREEQTVHDLTNLISSKQFLPAITMGLVHQVPIFDEEFELIRRWLERTCEEKLKLLKWYDNALTRVHRSKTRVPSSLFNLVRLLNSLLQKYTGLSISSGRKDPTFTYVLEVCRIAEPELLTRTDQGQSSIHEVAKRVVTEINEGASPFTFDIEGWGHLIPSWVEVNDISVDDPDQNIKIEAHQEAYRSSVDIRCELPSVEEENSLFILTPWFAPET
jgi:hypothetical protein